MPDSASAHSVEKLAVRPSRERQPLSVQAQLLSKIGPVPPDRATTLPPARQQLA